MNNQLDLDRKTEAIQENTDVAELLAASLRQAYLTVTPLGLAYGDQYYSSRHAIKEGWFRKAALDGTWTLPLSGIPRDGGERNLLYIEMDGQKIECRAIDGINVNDHELAGYYERMQQVREELRSRLAWRKKRIKR
ncbi:hypothetical protein [Paenibacillus gansuensis]|uniref:Uncharacterized protein n=1 Tax=Paenibacillus gansuensis TaxID=306542 RepID=A0ABW5PBQ6_9BACL